MVANVTLSQVSLSQPCSAQDCPAAPVWVRVKPGSRLLLHLISEPFSLIPLVPAKLTFLLLPGPAKHTSSLFFPLLIPLSGMYPPPPHPRLTPSASSFRFCSNFFSWEDCPISQCKRCFSPLSYYPAVLFSKWCPSPPNTCVCRLSAHRETKAPWEQGFCLLGGLQYLQYLAQQLCNHVC